MVFLTRGSRQSLYLSLATNVDPSTPIGELFENGPIRVRIMGIRDSQVRLGVQASPLLEVRREAQPDSPAHTDAA